MPLETLHTGPVALSQEQSDLVWDVLEGNAAVVSLLRTLGARPIPEGAQDRSWEAVKQIIPANRSSDAMERLPKEAPRGTAHDHQRPDAGLDSGWCHRLPLGNPPVRQTRERRERMVSWAEEPTPREWAFHAVCSQMRADRRRQQEAANKREHRREMWCEVAAGALAIATVVALVGIRLWVMG